MYSKICKYCGLPFETINPQKLYCDRKHYRPCPVCGKSVEMIDNDFSRSPRCCSSECSHILRQSKFKKRNCVLCGDEFTPRSGTQKACTKTHFDKCEICGNEFVRTVSNLESGVTTCSESCTKEKMKRNSLLKYGTAHPMQNSEVKKHFREAMFQKYGVEHALQIPGKTVQQQEAAYNTNMKNHGVPYACLTENCINANHDIVSNINKEFARRLQNVDIEVEFEKVLRNKSYDLYLPKLNTLVEIDPTYTHSNYPNHLGTFRDRYYHRDKTQLAVENGYRCVHVFDWDNWDQIIEMLSPKHTKIFARNCTVYKLNPTVGDAFLSEYHLQGSCRGQLLYLGLIYKNELVQIMTFGKPRYDRKHHVELLRLCTKSGYQVVGGASRLFSYATSEWGLHNIISYCDLSKFTGDVYEKIGMSLNRITPPNLIWSKNTQKVTSNLLRSRGYDQLFKTNYGKGTNNEELMLDSGWLPVYDCGQSVYEFI